MTRPPPDGVEQLLTRERLDAASGGHPVVRFDTGDGLHLPALGLPGTAAVAWCQTWTDGRRGVQLLGNRGEVARLLASPAFHPWFADQDPVHVTASREAYPAVDDALPVQNGNTWDWMWTTAPPVGDLAAEVRVQRLGHDEREALVNFLEAHNPGTHVSPFAHSGQQWVVVHDDEGHIIGSGCSEPGNSEVPLLGAITVDPTHRGHGLGAGITAYLTREAVARTGASSLGVFEDNARARDLYRRLGYQVGLTARTRFVVAQT